MADVMKLCSSGCYAVWIGDPCAALDGVELVPLGFWVTLVPSGLGLPEAGVEPCELSAGPLASVVPEPVAVEPSAAVVMPGVSPLAAISCPSVWPRVVEYPAALKAA